MFDPVEEALEDLDARVRELGVEIWIGAEPTFTDPASVAACWWTDPEGGDKLERARALLEALAPRLHPGASTARAEGRQYPDEDTPRFALGCAFPRKEDSALPPFSGPLEGPPIPPLPNDRAIAFLTVTPDPGVVELNAPPAPDLATFLRWMRHSYEAAAAAGLSAVRYRWNGQEADSGGGGQLTLGGPSPAESPFFVRPALLPSLLRFLNHHPSLSYWLAPACVGSASQGPRPDEDVRERFEELGVALDRLGVRTDLDPELLWGTFGPLLVDGSGNSHRAEVNVEKLWNPYFEGRGRLGLVELRALRMPPSPEHYAAVAALFVALVARLAKAPFDAPLVDWGAALHDRFALPSLLRADLCEVLADLGAHGFGLGPALAARLLDGPAPLVQTTLGDATLTVSPAREFWPLVGDVASQERRGARLVDSSTERVEVLVEVPAGAAPPRVGAVGWEVPLAHLGAEGERDRWIGAVRYRAFVPRPGLHPDLAAHEPLRLYFERGGKAVEVVLHAWIPGGGAYPGLPADADDATARRAARVKVVATRPIALAKAAGTGFTVDLRRLQPKG